jgi:hypothetical protein
MARMGEARNAYRILVRKPSKTLILKTEGNIKMDVRELRFENGWKWLRIVSSGGFWYQ